MIAKRPGLAQPGRCGLAFALLAACLSAACTTPGGPGQGDAGADVLQDSTQSTSFVLEGRLSVRYGDDSLAGKIAWNHQPLRDDISLASPLGNQLAQITRDASGVVLTDSRQQQVRADDAETLTERQLGWRLPLSGLTDWVRARASADGEARRDSAGRLVHLSEAGWEIEFAYESDLARRPHRLIMSYVRALRPLQIRLVIDTWAG